MGLQTLLGHTAKGFFIPYRHAETVSPVDYPALLHLFEDASPSFQRILDSIAPLEDELLALRGPPPRPRFDQDWFTGLDACAAYAIVAAARPKFIIEIGSGHSSRFMAEALLASTITCRQIAIDPCPRADISALPIMQYRVPLEQAPTESFQAIGDGDIVFVDSSHIAMPGSDVDRIINDILPSLPSGVFIHIHDTFLPWRYPAHWTWRGYNEQSLVAALIQGGGYELVFSSQFVRRAASNTKNLFQLPRLIERLAMPKNALETSLWIRKRSSRAKKPRRPPKCSLPPTP